MARRLLSLPAMPWRATAHKWFVQYNPLYFASAACLLGGIFLLGRDLPSPAFGSKVGIAAVTEAYQLLLALSAWLLLRAGQRRAAVILGLVAFFLLLDVAFNAERIFSHAGLLSLAPEMRLRRALPASAVLALLGPAKLILLARIFRIRRAGGLIAIGSGLLLAVPLWPYAIEAAGPGIVPRQAVHLAAAWLGAPFLAWGCTRGARRWFTEWAWDEWALTVTRRVAFALPLLMVATYAVHATAWGTLPELKLSPVHLAPYALVVTLAVAARLSERDSAAAEAAAWIGSATTLVLASFPGLALKLAPVTAMSLVISAGLLALAWRRGLRVLLPAVTLAAAGAWLLSPSPGTAPFWTAGAAALLAIAALVHRDLRCLAASSLAAGASLVLIDATLLPFGVITASTWLALWSWILFPALRRWIPFAATVVALAGGTLMLWNGVPWMAPAYASMALLSIMAGRAFARADFQFAGAAALVNLGICTRAAWLPTTAVGFGGMLVASAFVLLAAGVAYNLTPAWRRRSELVEAIPVGEPPGLD